MDRKRRGTKSRKVNAGGSLPPAYSGGRTTMDRLQYLKETSEALRKADDQRGQQRQHPVEQGSSTRGDAAARALGRFTSTLRAEGLESDGELWQCPSCRSQGRKPDYVLTLRLSGARVELICSRGCRSNTIRALLGAPPYFPTLARDRAIVKFPHG